MDNGFVYILKCGPYFKIGKARSLERRLRDYDRDAPFPYTLHFSKFVESKDKMEKRLHWFCRNYPRRGNEWFRLPRRKVWRIIKYLEALPEPRAETASAFRKHTVFDDYEPSPLH